MNTGPVYPCPYGLSVEHLNSVPAPVGTLLLGNSDLADSCVWVPTEITPGMAPLPVYPQPGDFPPGGFR